MRIGETAMIATRMFNSNMNSGNQLMLSLATGLRINRASDNPAGLIASQYISSTLAMMDAESRALSRADVTASAADGAMAEVSDLLEDAEGIAVAAANTGGLSQAERDGMQVELDSILKSVDRIGSSSSFNGRHLLDGRMSVSVGDDTITFAHVSADQLGIAGASLSGDPEATADAFRAARAQISTARAEIGAFQKDAIMPRVRSLGIATENAASAISLIRDTDYASATSNFARQSILIGASGISFGFSMSQGASVLSLLAG